MYLKIVIYFFLITEVFQSKDSLQGAINYPRLQEAAKKV